MSRDVLIVRDALEAAALHVPTNVDVYDALEALERIEFRLATLEAICDGRLEGRPCPAL